MKASDLEDYDPEIHPKRWPFFILGFVIVFALIGAVTWGIGVLTSDVNGRGNVIKKTNSSDNRIFAQQYFEDMYAQIQAYDRNLNQAALDKAEHPGDPTFAANYTGLVQQCNNAIASYDAAARKITQERFRAADLPSSIDTTDPKTDCKESAK